ncbi:ABC-F family ATP-binding cassette domain-containing protein [Amycolatopsis sp. CA-230715]|uniref:ABC-F family ATP-binding cassette domain-containing protein n=1 Tax=Amycolatopsis sp. CA-230715 TaxID=2745196 RepID=UPI001C019040|nr:ATP-binding cassette domain-containing protein [Amycolatopsis sp. CA-230715]QWF78460.1 putative ABC transporter ATP-binding protein YheS [Amycolatopsis sp. CA-230715]
MSVTVILSGLAFAWPDSRAVFTGLDAVFGEGRTGLVGVNGAGKSTLLRLIAGELRPSSGDVRVAGSVGYLPQNLILDADRRVDDVLGLAETRAALAAIEEGEAGEAQFAAVEGAWDVEERTHATLDRLGLGHVGLDRRAGQLSGGEVVLLGLAAQLLRVPDVLLLDEPTNNLDLRAKHYVHEAIRSWRGALILVSHDRETLELVDRIGDLRDGDLSFYGGNLSAYEAAVAAEQEAAERTVRVAEADFRREKRELADTQVKLARRQRYGKKMFETKREPKVRMRKRAEDAQIAAGKLRNTHLDRLNQARDRLQEAKDAVRDDAEIRIDLPDTKVPQGMQVLELSDVELATGQVVSLSVRGPERIALIGDNGTGKTTLLHTVMRLAEPRSGTARTFVPARFLPQRLDILDDNRSAVDNVSDTAPSAGDNAIRAQLARFLLRGRQADQLTGTLSGGERFRAALATLLLAEPAPRLLLLDEPTNNLDLASVRKLTQALESYSGALVVVSHDVPFLRDIGISRWLRLGSDRLEEVDPL